MGSQSKAFQLSSKTFVSLAMDKNLLLCGILCSLLVSFASGQDEACEGGYQQFGEDCYGYVHLPETWFDAQSACKAVGGFLAEPMSTQQDIFLKGIAAAPNAKVVWLGGEDLMQEGKWFWSHSQIPIDGKTYDDWLPGEPNNSHDENCMHQVNSHWNDISCDNKYAFICQRPLSSEIIG